MRTRILTLSLLTGLLCTGLAACVVEGDDGTGGAGGAANAVCGNGVAETGESCDGADLGGQSCTDLSFTGGDLACNANCTFDDSGCTGGTCGNNVLDAGEQCDPPDGTTCDANCMLIGQTACDEPDSYDTDCATSLTGQWCWDGGDGSPLHCGCDSDYGNVDCQIDGYGLCNPATNLCEVTPVCGADANEDNDTEATATALVLDTPITGAICAFDEDWFSFTATSAAALVAASWTDDGSTDLDLRVTDCAGGVLASNASVDPAQETVIATGLTPATTYCVSVVHYSGAAGGADAAYSLQVGARTTCTLDSQCAGAEVCGVVGAEAGVCSTTPPPNAGCGDTVPGDNDTSGLAETLTSGVAVTEGSCDGNPDNPADVDWFTFTVAAGDTVSVSANQASGLADGDIDLRLYDANGALWAVAATVSNPEIIAGGGLPAGTYYVLASYYDNDSATPASTSYDITLTLTAGTGCATRDDCAGFYQHGECAANVCSAFDGGGAQGPGAFCDDTTDCDPATTGSQFLSGLCFTADQTLGSDNVCVIDCTGEGDCTPFGMHCLVVSAPDGICIAPCQSDAGCGGAVCDTGTGICAFP